MQIHRFDNAFQIHAFGTVLLCQDSAILPHGRSLSQFIIGQQHRDAPHAARQRGVQACQQRVQPLARHRAGAHGRSIEQRRVLHTVTFIVHNDLRDISTAQLAQHVVRHGQLRGSLRVRSVANFQNHVRKGGLLQRAFERLHQIVRQPAYKAYGVYSHTGQPRGQRQTAGCRVQRGKQHVSLQHLRAAKAVQQAGFPHIGIPYQRHHGHTALFAALTRFGTAALQLFQAFAQRVDAAAHMAAVVFQLAFARAAAGTCAAAPAAALTGQAGAKARQTGQTVLQRGKLRLQFAFIRHGPACEYLQNQHGAVYDLHLQQLLQISDLAAGQLGVEHGALRAQVDAQHTALGQAAFAQKCGRLRRFTLLHHLRHGFHAVCLC